MTGIWRELALDTSAISISADSLSSSPEATTGATATLLSSGRVVVFGGRDSNDQTSDRVFVADESALLSLVVNT